MTYEELVTNVKRLAGALSWSVSIHTGDMKIVSSHEYCTYAINIGEIAGPGSYACNEPTADEAWLEIRRQLPPKDSGDLS